MININNEDIHDPRINLAIEEFSLRHLDPEKDYLFLYVNNPSVIIGRHQNPFSEVNIRQVIDEQIPVLRRISGGGTVYHDRGNLNFSFITSYSPHKLHNFKYFNTPLVEALNKIGIDAELNNNNDITIDGKKFSGNAQHSTRGRMVSHGTLLFNSDLVRLTNILQDRSASLDTKATPSRRSSVTNISPFLAPGFSLDDFTKRLRNELTQSQGPSQTYHLTNNDWVRIRNYCTHKYSQWDWNFGKTPPFTLHRQNNDIELTMVVESGFVRELHVNCNFMNNKKCMLFTELLKGIRFYPSDLREKMQTAQFQKIIDPVTPDYFMNLFFELPVTQRVK